MVKPLRVLMLGTPAFAVPTFEALLASSHTVVGLMCQPDRPRGRGQKVAPPPTKTLAGLRGVPVLQPAKLKEPALLDEVAALAPDIGVVAAYGRILPDALINLPTRGMINVHASLLPRYRGAAPIHRAVIAGDDVTGVTIMRVVRELDAGPMLGAAPLPIGPDDTSVEVEIALARLGAALLVRTLDRLAAGEAVPEIPQDDRLATYAAKIERADGVIDWTQAASRIHNQVRGLHPWPRAFTFLDSERVVIHKTAKTFPVEYSRLDVKTTRPTGNIQPGTISADGVVATGDGALRVLEIQPEGRRVMQMREWLAGRRDIAAGARFTNGPA